MKLPAAPAVPAPQQRRLLLGLAAVLAILLAVALGTEGVALRNDPRVRVLSPVHLDEVRPPVTVSWQVTDPTLAQHVQEGNVYFAVFVDRPPVAPGENLHATLTAECIRNPDCPTRGWFAERHIYITRGSVLELGVLPQRLGPGGQELHQATIVLLDDTGTRLGESVWTTRFFLARHAEEDGP